MSTDKPPFCGPLETHPFPSRLSARVVTPGAEPRLHGYSVQLDLARYYGLSELWLLCLTQELPRPEAARAFSVACWFLAPVSIAEASVHAAVLSRLCGAPSSATLASAAVALAEQARFELARFGDLLLYLSAPDGCLPEAHCARTPEQSRALEPLLGALSANQVCLPELGGRPTLEAALVAVLYHCGLTRLEQLEAALVFARLPVATAEAFAARRCQFGEYPINLPRYVYQSPDTALREDVSIAREGAL